MKFDGIKAKLPVKIWSCNSHSERPRLHQSEKYKNPQIPDGVGIRSILIALHHSQTIDHIMGMKSKFCKNIIRAGLCSKSEARKLWRQITSWFFSSEDEHCLLADLSLVEPEIKLTSEQCAVTLKKIVRSIQTNLWGMHRKVCRHLLNNITGLQEKDCVSIMPQIKSAIHETTAWSTGPSQFLHCLPRSVQEQCLFAMSFSVECSLHFLETMIPHHIPSGERATSIAELFDVVATHSLYDDQAKKPSPALCRWRIDIAPHLINPKRKCLVNLLAEAAPDNRNSLLLRVRSHFADADWSWDQTVDACSSLSL